MKKVVLKVDLHDDKAKHKAMKTVSTLSGIDSIAVDMKTGQVTVIGSVDPVNIVSKLRKYWPSTSIDLVGPAKEPEKKEEAKKEEPKKDGEKKEEAKKDEAKKEEGGGGGDQKKEEPKKEGGDNQKKEEPKKDAPLPQPVPDPILEMIKAQRFYNPHNQVAPYNPYMHSHHHHPTSYYYVHSMEENPNACVIC